MLRTITILFLALVAACGGGGGGGAAGAGDCNAGNECTVAASLHAKCGNCNCGGSGGSFGQNACMQVATGACGSASDSTAICTYMECILAGPTCVAGQEAAYIQANEHCLAYYGMLSSACQSAIQAATK